MIQYFHGIIGIWRKMQDITGICHKGPAQHGHFHAAFLHHIQVPIRMRAVPFHTDPLFHHKFPDFLFPARLMAAHLLVAHNAVKHKPGNAPSLGPDLRQLLLWHHLRFRLSQTHGMVLQTVLCHKCIILEFFRIAPVYELLFQDASVHVHA